MSNKIDSLVAEKVMEWVRHPRNTAHWVEGGRDPFMAPVMGLVPECGTGAWSPSTSISAAWAVVEKMKTDNWRVSVEDFGNRYRINFSKGSQWQAFNSVEHINVPLGICVAALRAVGVDEATIQEAMK